MIYPNDGDGATRTYTAPKPGTGATPTGDGRSLGDLFKDLAAGTQSLVRQEIKLARLEIRESLQSGIQGAAMFAVAGVFALVGLIALAFTLVAVLSLALAPWLSALIVTVLFFAIAGAFALIGKSRLAKANPKPDETIETLKEDQQWLKQQIK